MNKLEKFLLDNGYKLVGKRKLEDEPDVFDIHKIFPDFKPIAKDIRNLGFSSKYVVTVDFFKREYIARIYIPKENSEDN